MTALPVCNGKHICCSAEAFPVYPVLGGDMLEADCFNVYASKHTFNVRIIQQMHKVPANIPAWTCSCVLPNQLYIGGRGNYTEVGK